MTYEDQNRREKTLKSPPNVFIRLCVVDVFEVCILAHTRDRSKTKRVQVTFTEEQWKLIEKFRGVMGNDDAEIVRNIVLAWLAEKSLVTETVKKEIKRG